MFFEKRAKNSVFKIYEMKFVCRKPEILSSSNLQIFPLQIYISFLFNSFRFAELRFTELRFFPLQFFHLSSFTLNYIWVVQVALQEAVPHRDAVTVVTVPPALVTE